MAVARAREKLGSIAVWLLVIAALPFAPLAYVVDRLNTARQRRRLARYCPVASIEPAGSGYRLLLKDGSELRVDPQAVQHATWEDWGDGINGSRIDRGLCLDRNVRIRFDGWSSEYKPLVAALHERGLLAKHPSGGRLHPDDGGDYLFLVAAFCLVIDVIAFGIIRACRS